MFDCVQTKQHFHKQRPITKLKMTHAPAKAWLSLCWWDRRHYKILIKAKYKCTVSKRLGQNLNKFQNYNYDYVKATDKVL